MCPLQFNYAFKKQTKQKKRLSYNLSLKACDFMYRFGRDWHLCVYYRDGSECFLEVAIKEGHVLCLHALRIPYILSYHLI